MNSNALAFLTFISVGLALVAQPATAGNALGKLNVSARVQAKCEVRPDSVQCAGAKAQTLGVINQNTSANATPFFVMRDASSVTFVF